MLVVREATKLAASVGGFFVGVVILFAVFEGGADRQDHIFIVVFGPVVTGIFARILVARWWRFPDHVYPTRWMWIGVTLIQGLTTFLLLLAVVTMGICVQQRLACR